MSKDSTLTPNERLHGVSWRELITEALASAPKPDAAGVE